MYLLFFSHVEHPCFWSSTIWEGNPTLPGRMIWWVTTSQTCLPGEYIVIVAGLLMGVSSSPGIYSILFSCASNSLFAKIYYLVIDLIISCLSKSTSPSLCTERFLLWYNPHACAQTNKTLLKFKSKTSQALARWFSKLKDAGQAGNSWPLHNFVLTGRMRWAIVIYPDLKRIYRQKLCK